MIAAAMTFVILSIFALVMQQKRIERLEGERDDLIVDLSRRESSRAFWRKTAERSLRQQLALQRRLRQTEAALVEAGAEAATHASHLEALIDATREPEGLRLVKGANRG